jgi:hypothetical protein
MLTSPRSTKRRAMRRNLPVFLLPLATASTLLFTSPAAYAQADQGAITGTVHDASGAIVPNATITLTDTATGFTLTEKTDGSGNYTASPLKLGTYTVKATAPGFTPAVEEGVVVNASTTTTEDLALSVAGGKQTVIVTGAPPPLETQSAATGQVVSSRVINNTPLNGRNFTFIAQLSAGVEPSEQGSRGAAKGDFSANGQRSEQNNFILDGVDNNSNLADFLNGASYVIKPPPDALQEFNVQTGDYSAELGHSAGAVLNVATKSGGNQIHGDLWEYFRNDVLNSRDYFETQVPKYRQNQFGTTIGGPIIKNKLFYFGDAEANRIIFGQTGIYSVPTPLMRTGNFSELLNSATNGRGQAITLYQPGGPNPGTTNTNYLSCNGVQNVICPTQIDAVAQKLLNAYPLPNLGGSGNTINNYTFQGNASDNTTQYDGRVDWNIRQADQAFARYSYTNEPVNLTSPLGILDGGSFGGSGTTVTEGRNFTASETHLFSPSFINEFRFGYNWIAAAYVPSNSGTDLSTQYGLGGIPFSAGNGGLPYFAMSGISEFGSPQYEPTHEYENVAQILDNLTKQVGNHALRFGVDFERIRVQTNQPIDPKGTLTFDGKFTEDPNNTATTGFGAADLLLNSQDTSSIANIFTAHDQRWYRAAYFQDTWKAMSKLTVNMGLRYEYTQPTQELDGQQANFVPDYANNSATYLIPAKDENNPADTLTPKFLSALAANNVTVQYTNNNFLVNPAKTDFSPRLGIDYQLDDKTVVRAGFGTFYGGLESVGYYPSLSQNFPFQYDSNFPSGNCTGPGACPTNGQTLETGFSAALQAGLANYVNTPGFRGYATHTQTPYSEQYNLSVERTLGNSTTATIGYVGSVSHHLQSNPDGNIPDQVVPAGENEQQFRPYNQFGGSSLIVYAGAANYNSLQMTLQHRLQNGLSFLGAYTWSHALDDSFTLLGGSGQSGSGYRNQRLLGYGYDYGSSYTNVAQRFTLNAQYELPFGYGKRYLSHRGVTNELVGGWATTMLFRVQTGEPIGVYANNNPAGTGNAYAYKVADPFKPGGTPTSTNTTCATHTRTVQTWFNPCAYVNPPQVIPAVNPTTGAANVAGAGQILSTDPNVLSAYGPRGRTMVAGPGYNRVDLSAFKNFAVYRETSLQFRADIFNLFNTPAYGQPGGTTGGGFGQITSERFGGGGTAGENPDARVVQFALKYLF